MAFNSASETASQIAWRAPIHIDVTNPRSSGETADSGSDAVSPPSSGARMT